MMEFQASNNNLSDMFVQIKQELKEIQNDLKNKIEVLLFNFLNVLSERDQKEATPPLEVELQPQFEFYKMDDTAARLELVTGRVDLQNGFWRRLISTVETFVENFILQIEESREHWFSIGISLFLEWYFLISWTKTDLRGEVLLNWNDWKRRKKK